MKPSKCKQGLIVPILEANQLLEKKLKDNQSSCTNHEIIVMIMTLFIFFPLLIKKDEIAIP